MQFITDLPRGGDSSYQAMNLISVIMKARDLDYKYEPYMSR